MNEPDSSLLPEEIPEDDPEFGFGDAELEPAPLEPPVHDVTIDNEDDSDVETDESPREDVPPDPQATLDAEPEAELAAPEIMEEAPAPESSTPDTSGENDDRERLLEDYRGLSEKLEVAEAEVKRVEALEDRITEMQQTLIDRDKRIAELEEKLDTEAARSYRLSQRRIPALNKELEQATEQARELERKLQKAELKASTFEEQAKELKARVADLERALEGAKARAQDTTIIQPEGADAQTLIGDEVRRLTNRLADIEEERGRLAEVIRTMDDRHRGLLDKFEQRAERLEKESDERFAELVALRKDTRSANERFRNIARLADDLAGTSPNGRPLVESIRKLAASGDDE